MAFSTGGRRLLATARCLSLALADAVFGALFEQSPRGKGNRPGNALD